MFNNPNHTTISISTGTMIRMILILLGIFLIWFLRDFVLVVLTSLIIASFVEAALPYFKKLKIGRVAGVVIFYVISLSVLAGIFYLFAPLLITEVYNFATFMSSYVPGVDFLDFFQNEAFSGAKEVVDKLSSKNFSVASLLAVSKAFIENLSGGFVQTLAVAFGSLVNVILIVIISFYLSIQEKGIENFLRIILPIKYEDYAIDLWKRSQRKIALWMKGQLLLALLVTVLIYLILSLRGIEYALLLAIIAGVTEFVPYGVLIALIPAISFSYVTGGITTALFVAGVYIIIHQFEVFLFSPLIIKGVVGLSPLVVIIAVVLGYELAGFWGLILAIPMAVILLEFMSDIEKRKKMLKKENE